jgi:polysaccharide export outer membrane protein
VLRTLAFAFAALALAACASSSSSIPTAELPPPDPAALATVNSAADYHIGPMDTLDINVFQAPNLNRTVQVDATGVITMPLIGPVKAAGRTTSELQQAIATALDAKYLQSPQVSVAVKEFASQKVTVDGAVEQPGVYPIRGRATLLQAIAMAKGADKKSANEKQVVIFRTVNGERMAARFDLTEIRAGRADDPTVYADDLIVVDRSGARSLLRSVASVLPTVAIFQRLIF